MSSLISHAKNIASVKSGDPSKEYTEIIFACEISNTKEKAEIIQLSFFLEGKQKGVYHEYYSPKSNLSFETMAKNWITPEMLEGKQNITEPNIALDKLKTLNSDKSVLIAHNVGFDVEMLHRAGVDNITMKTIDTYRLAKALLPDAEKYSMMSLFFQYGLYKKLGSMEKKMNEEFSISLKKLGQRNKLYDLTALKLLYEMLLKKAGSVEKLIEISSSPIFMQGKLGFGKYKNLTPEEIVKKDKSYAEWFIENSKNDKDLKFTFKKLIKNKKEK